MFAYITQKLPQARHKTAAMRCSWKSVSKSITSTFKLLLYQFESYNDKSNYYYGVEIFAQILNNEPGTYLLRISKSKVKPPLCQTLVFPPYTLM